MHVRSPWNLVIVLGEVPTENRRHIPGDTRRHLRFLETHQLRFKQSLKCQIKLCSFLNSAFEHHNFSIIYHLRHSWPLLLPEIAIKKSNFLPKLSQYGHISANSGDTVELN